MNAATLLIKLLAEEADVRSRHAALINSLEQISENEKSCILILLLGRVPKRVVTTKTMRQWILQYSGIGSWIYRECCKVVGDRNIAASLMIPIKDSSKQIDIYHVYNAIVDLQGRTEEEIKQALIVLWKKYDQDGIVLLNKLVTGRYRSPVPASEVYEILSTMTGIEPFLISRTLSGKTEVQDLTTGSLFRVAENKINGIVPVAYQSVDNLSDFSVMNTESHLCEWMYRGIRAQIIKEDDQIHIWARGGENFSSTFGGLGSLHSHFPERCLIDVQLVYTENGIPGSEVQLRENLKSKADKKGNVIYILDMLMLNDQDIRSSSLSVRKNLVKTHFKFDRGGIIREMQELPYTNLQDLNKLGESSFDFASGGLIFKDRSSAYDTKGAWLKWDLQPRFVNLILMYAQRSGPSQSGPYNEFTFGVRDGINFVPVVRCTLAADSAMLSEINDIVEDNIVERFGPVRSLKPDFCFKIGYREIASSRRHKAGIQLREAHIVSFINENPISLDELKRIYQVLKERQILNYKQFNSRI